MDRAIDAKVDRDIAHMVADKHAFVYQRANKGWIGVTVRSGPTRDFACHYDCTFY